MAALGGFLPLLAKVNLCKSKSPRVEEEAGNVYVLSLGYFFDHVFCWCSFAEPCDYSLIAEMIKLYWLKK